MTGEILPPEGEFAPIAQPVLAMEDAVLIPLPRGGGHGWVPLRAGLHCGWVNVPEIGKAMLVLFAGHAAETGFAVTMTREGLLEHIADLQSIARQMVSPGGCDADR